MNRSLRHGVLGLALLGAAVCAFTQVALPHYTPGHFIEALHRHALAPQAERFAEQVSRLEAGLRSLCAAPPDAATAALAEARAGWAAAVDHWERLSAVAVGPLVQRRSQRTIDFAPTRPESIRRAIASTAGDAAAMAKVGAPAKGLPAVEWLLWSEPVQPATPACRYAVQAAAEVAGEAGALAVAYGELARQSAPQAAAAAMSEALNQWIGGIERLRWQQLEKALRAGRDGGRAPAFPRAASGQTAATWSAQWQALRDLGAGAAADAPQPGESLLTWELLLRGRGLNPAADALRAAAGEADAAMRRLSPAQDDSVLAAARALAELKRVAESELAPALQVNIGFSDADGD